MATTAPALETDYAPTRLVPLGQLIPAPWNPRLIRDKRFQQLCASLEADPQFLWDRPIIANASHIIYAGNMRWRAAEHLGWKAIPARITDVDDKTAKERALRDNNQFGEWVDQDLAELLVGLQMDGSDLALLGFPDDEVRRLLDSVGALGDTPVPEAQIDRAAELQAQWGTALGDLWEIPSATVPGRCHRLLCGDSTDAAAVARLMDGARAAMLFTDPPYGVAYRDTGAGAWGPEKLARKKAGALEPRFEAIDADELSGEALVALWTAFLRTAKSVLDERGAVYCCFASLRGPEVFAAYAAAGFEPRAELIWLKSRPGFNFAHYKHQHEPILYGAPLGGALNWYGDATQVSVLNVKSEPGSAYLHPTQKPVELAQQPIRNSSRPGDVVLEPFCGSGMTLLAAETTGRLGYGLEIEPKYVAVVLERLKAVGLEPRRVGDVASVA